MTDKKKKSSYTTDSRTQFVLAWIGGTWVAWFVGLFLTFVLMIAIFLLMTGEAVSDPLGMGVILYILILPATALVGKMQQDALKDHLNIYVPHWWWLTALMWSLGIFLAVNISNTLFAGVEMRPLWGSAVFFTIVLGVPGSVQALLLYRHLSQTWLYAFASLISGVIWGVLSQENNGQFWTVAPAVSAVISAIVLLWLTSPVTARLTTRKEKSKS